MAYFAELDNDNNVIRCVSIPDSEILTKAGVESEKLGVTFCNNLFGASKWKQTSFNGRIRLNFAGPGMLYHSGKDVFVYPPKHPWYELGDDYVWRSPVGTHPDTGEPLEDWQWEFLEVAYKLKPEYEIFNNSIITTQNGAV